MAREKKVIRCGVLGYGGAFNMGKHHAEWMTQTPGLEIAAACDVDPGRAEQAKGDFPQIKVFTSLATMLAKGGIDLVVIITPHNTHARLAIQCAKAGKHVIVEKPMCLSSKEAAAMVETAKAKKVMLSVFHNRRWDADYVALRQVVASGAIGEVFQVETGGGGYGHPGKWWRADKKISGGTLWDWGAHFMDWILGLKDEKVVDVTAYFQKRKWHDITNEDHAKVMIRFQSGATAELQMSTINRGPRPKWRILGTEGAIILPGSAPNTLRLYTALDGLASEADVKYKPAENWPAYYNNIAAHLLKGEALAVTAESARRAISVLDAAEQSARTGKAVKPAFP